MTEDEATATILRLAGLHWDNEEVEKFRYYRQSRPTESGAFYWYRNRTGTNVRRLPFFIVAFDASFGRTRIADISKIAIPHLYYAGPAQAQIACEQHYATGQWPPGVEFSGRWQI